MYFIYLCSPPYIMRFGLNGFQHFQKPGVIFRHHNAEPDKFTVETLERTAVADHKIVFYAQFKYVEGSNIRLQDSEKQEVRVWEIRLKCRKFLYLSVHSVPF